MDNGTVEKKKDYWLKPGLPVLNKNWPEIDMVVSKIHVKNEGTDQKPRTRVLYVECHWMNAGKQETGKFHTTELKPR